MNTNIWKSRQNRLLIEILLCVAIFIAAIFIPNYSPAAVSAHSGDIFGPKCGRALLDGNVGTTEWSNASKKTFLMKSASTPNPFTATLYVMNSAKFLYIGITISDNDFSTYGQYLEHGDGFRIDFDNDHSGTLFALNDDVLGIAAGLPQFDDSYVYAGDSSQSDLKGGGTQDGAGAASRVGTLNHFELRHPLCSGDSRDFCLHPNDTVGFRLEYLDAKANGDFGSTQYYPDTANTSEADITIGVCSIPDYFIYLPIIKK